jgi:hypothetical protein
MNIQAAIITIEMKPQNSTNIFLDISHQFGKRFLPNLEEMKLFIFTNIVWGMELQRVL